MLVTPIIQAQAIRRTHRRMTVFVLAWPFSFLLTCDIAALVEARSGVHLGDAFQVAVALAVLAAIGIWASMPPLWYGIDYPVFWRRTVVKVLLVLFASPLLGGLNSLLMAAICQVDVPPRPTTNPLRPDRMAVSHDI